MGKREWDWDWDWDCGVLEWEKGVVAFMDGDGDGNDERQEGDRKTVSSEHTGLSLSLCLS